MKVVYGELEGTRRCGSCTLCCKLLPVKEIGKLANTRCDHQRSGKGCAVYRKPGFPRSCHMWNCVWLIGEPETAKLSRPDRVHYVIDPQPDYVTVVMDANDQREVPVIQIWLDPAYPEAHRDPALREYLAFAGREWGAMAICRTGSTDAIVICPPNMSADGQWREEATEPLADKEHTFDDVMRVLGG